MRSFLFINWLWYYSDMKSKKSKSKKINIFRPTINRVYGAAIIVLFLALFVQSYFVTYLWQEQQRDGVIQTRYLIETALNGLYNLGKDMTVVDYNESTLKIPQAKIVLPLDAENHRGIGAIFNEQSGDLTIPSSISFTENAAMSHGIGGLDMNSMKGLFNTVPQAQACTRQVVVVFNETGESEYTADYTLAFEKILTDGRNAKGYKSTVCVQGADELAAYVKQLNSY